MENKDGTEIEKKNICVGKCGLKGGERSRAKQQRRREIKQKKKEEAKEYNKKE